MSEQSAPTAVSLLERGHYFLQEEQFKAADLYFNRVLDAEPNNHAAYWGLLLCAYQCRNTAELYTVNAAPFDNNTHYQHALEHADEASAAGYRAVLGSTLLACHARILEHFEAGNAFLLKEWAAHYKASAAKNPAFEALHKLINKDGKPARLADPTTAATLLAFDRLYDGVDTSPDKIDKLIDKLRTTVKRLYAAATKQALEDLARLHPAKNAALDQWAQPTATALLPEIDLSAARIGLDGNGQTISARYLTLAAALEKTAHKTEADCAAILYCYEQAEAHAASDEERKAAEAAKRAYSDRAVAGADVPPAVILYFIGKFPQNGDYCRRYVAYQTADYGKKLTSYPTDKALSNFLEKKRDDYTVDTAEEMAQKQLSRITECEQEYAAHLADVTPYADKALLLLAEPQAFKTDWDAYCARIREQHEKTLATLRERHSQVVKKRQADDKAGSSGATSKGVFAVIGAYLAVCLSVPLLLCALYTLKNPAELLQYPLIPTFLIALGACWILHLIKRGITKKLKNYHPTKYALPKACTVLLKLAPTLSLLFSLACAATFVYSFVTFPKNIGAIPIACVEDFVHIKRAPNANFILTADITVDTETSPQIKRFYGNLNGNGHTITNLTINEYAIKTNHGIIENLTLKSPVFIDDGAMTRRNRGTLRNVIVTKPKLGEDISFYGLAEQNRGRMESCTIKSAGGPCSSFVGFTEKNFGEILACSVTDANLTVDADFAGIAGVNERTLAGCSFSGNVKSHSAYGLTRLLRNDKATVKQCFTSGNLTATVRLSGLIGGVRDACVVENCYSTAKLTLKPSDPYNSYAIGLIGGIDDIKDNKTAIVRHCYFGGSVNTRAGKGTTNYGFVGAMVGDTDISSGRSDYQKEYYIDFDGCFAVASYSFGVKRSADSEGYLPVKIDTSYFTSVHDLSDVLVTTSKPAIANKSRVLNTKFLTKTMGWDTEIWNIQNGKLPTLKPYVIPVEVVATDDNSASEEGTK